MARNYLSDHYNKTAASALPQIPAIIVPQSVDKAYLRYKRGEVDLSASSISAGDQIRMFTLKSGDRINEMVISTDASWVFVANLGLYQAGFKHTGIVLDADLFASALDFDGGGSGLIQQEVLTEATTILDEERGTPLWTMLGQSEEPFEYWDMTFTQTSGTTGSRMILEVYYTREGG